MKKILPVLLFLTFAVILTRCEKGKTDTYPIHIITDKTTYSLDENIIIELTNNSDSIARYFVCSSFKGIPPNVEKLENNSWIGYWGPVCNGYSSYCCAILQPGETYKDTLDLDLVKGTYRIEYQFIVRPSHDYKSFYSSSIKIK